MIDASDADGIRGQPPIPLDRPLPPELLLHRLSRGLAAYRSYPAFSWPWLCRRTVLFALVIAGVGLLSGAGTYLTGGRALPAVGVAVQFTVAMLLITTAGPALATVVRHRGFPLARERLWLLGALACGVLASYRVDQWASRGVGEKTGADFEGNVLAGQGMATGMSPGAIATNLVLLAVVYGVAGGGLAVRSYLAEPGRLQELRRQGELAALRVSRQAALVRLGVLQAQVEPHFLFNTLASVRSLIPADPGRAQSTIDALVDYLRATIPRLRDDAAQADSGISSTLGQQLEICESYLRLMQVRMGDRLSYQIDVPAGERATSFPPLLLITLVENAVKHGIEPRPGPGRIVIRIVRQAGRLTVTVQDDGQGLRDGFGTGVGLGNVREQLLVRYGERARVTLSGAAGGGTVASIVIADEDRA
jgi:hypothetical protein